MFQYALGRHLTELGKNIKYDLSYFESHPEHYFGLERFGLQLPKAKRNDVLCFLEDRHRIIDRLRRKLFGRRPYVFSEINESIYIFRPEVFEFSKGFINGYWQSEKYFADIAEIINGEFTFPISTDSRNNILAEEMQKCTSVSIHVRRGDYLGGFPVLDEAYYSPAMQYFQKKFNDVHFYVFSNDIPWCKDHFNSSRLTFVDWNTGDDSIFDMWLMTQCKHNIIANSSFSWWGAWLNQHSNKEVIAPSIWFNHAQTPDIYAKGWTVLSIEK